METGGAIQWVENIAVAAALLGAGVILARWFIFLSNYQSYDPD